MQANISHYDQLRADVGTYEAVRQILDAHFALSRDALRAKLDLLVWPETVYPTTFGSPKSEDGAAFDREIASFAAEPGVPLIFGAYEAEGGDEFNAAVFLEPRGATGRASTMYRKARALPAHRAGAGVPRLRRRAALAAVARDLEARDAAARSCRWRCRTAVRS